MTFFELSQRMDELALMAPKERSWESLYKQIRKEVNDMIQPEVAGDAERT